MMTSFRDTNESALKKRATQDSSDPETCCQKCDAVIKQKIMCRLLFKMCWHNPHFIRIPYTGRNERLSGRVKVATFPSLDNITRFLKDSLDENDTRMTKLEDRVGKLKSGKESVNKAVLFIILVI